MCTCLSAGLVVVDIAAADDDTAFAFHALLVVRWATTSVERTNRDAGQSGVRLRCFLDLCQFQTGPVGTELL
ncbi:DUF6207 family protein [Streptomyces sp. NPDC096191]|uniref:DUF6207 family protein n=1 Tax=Streptomyces sp. NPDC096191 TaxID=3155426 RepID=UPI00332EFCE7